MFTSRNFKALFLLAAPLLFLHSNASAQSGRNPPAPKTPPGMQPAPAPTPGDYTHYDKVKVVVSYGIDQFVKALNEQGRLGYRLEKTVSYGDTGERRRYAAVLHLDPGHRYEYDSDPMPDDALYGDPLNYYARRGYSLAHTYAVTRCPKEDIYADSSDPSNSPTMKTLLTTKGSVFLFMRRDGARAQTKEYKLFKGFYGIGGKTQEDLQAALDAAPPGFRPVSLLFSNPHLFTVNVSVVAERDLSVPAPKRVEYRVVKEVEGFEEEVNRHAAEGSRYVGGGRIESIKVALLERRAGDPAFYTFIDDQKHAKEFPRMTAAGYSYVGLLGGDTVCESPLQVKSQKLVFARDAAGAPARAYKILELSDRKPDKMTGVLPDAAVSELQRYLADGFRVRDIFYAYGLYLILEKQTEPRAPQAQTGER